VAEIKQLKPNQIYQLKISLDHIKPEIWRRFMVNSNIKLPDLHKVIQTVMGWYNSHLHQFRIDNTIYSMPDEEAYTEYVDYRKIRLNQVIDGENQEFYYDYDFGDGWEHTLILEKITTEDKKTDYPRCLDGKRNCPPEDCGGWGGYEDLLEIIKNPEHEEYSYMMDWLGGAFDPEEFYIDEINEMLREKDYGCISLFD